MSDKTGKMILIKDGANIDTSTCKQDCNGCPDQLLYTRSNKRLRLPPRQHPQCLHFLPDMFQPFDISIFVFTEMDSR